MILSIESSCDDSSLALTSIENSQLLFHLKISQDEEHSNYGGIVPEIASRLHAEQLPKILKKLGDFLRNDFSSIKAVAVTTRPGLSVTLIEGVMMAKALCLALNVPLICVNHLKGHIYSLFIASSAHSHVFQNPSFPLATLLISGGHTQILEIQSFEKMRVIASTLDDSFGESFDKVAKYLDLGYPGGPQVEQKAREFMTDFPHLQPHNFPIPLLKNKNLEFSFSGLKNAVRMAVSQLPRPLSAKDIGSICVGFERSACEHLVRKTELYFQTESAREVSYFALVGGASANLYVREAFENLCRAYDKTLLLAPLEFCSDNAGMIGRAGIEQYKRGDFTPLHSVDIAPKSYDGDFQA